MLGVMYCPVVQKFYNNPVIVERKWFWYYLLK